MAPFSLQGIEDLFHGIAHRRHAARASSARRCLRT
jgi:hypothetical protein